VLEDWCEKVGRDPSEIRRVAIAGPETEDSLDELVEAGFTHFITFSAGPDWDLGKLRELLAWRDARVPA